MAASTNMQNPPAQHSRAVHASLIFALMGMALYWPMLRRNVFFFILPSTDTETETHLWIALFYLLVIVLTTACCLGARSGRNKGISGLATENPVAVGVLWTLFGLLGILKLADMLGLAEGTAGHVCAGVASGAFAVLLVALTLLWASRFVAMDAHKGTLILVGAFVLSFFVKCIAYLPDVASFAISAFLPAASFGFYRASMRLATPSSAREPAVDTGSLRSAPLFSSIVLIACFLFAGGVMRGLTAGALNASIAHPPFSQDMGTVLFALVILLACLRIPSVGQTERRLWAVALVMFFAGLLLIAVVSAGPFDAGNQALVMGRTCLELFLWLMLADSVRSHGANLALAFGGMFLIVDSASALAGYVIAPAAIQAAGLSLDDTVGNVSTVTMFILAAVSVCVYAHALGSRDERALGATDPKNVTHDANDRIRTPLISETERLRGLAIRFNLTERETQIAQLLVDGNSQKHVAEVLGCSMGTVQTHCKALYRKLGIHSKQELVNMVRA